MQRRPGMVDDMTKPGLSLRRLKLESRRKHVFVNCEVTHQLISGERMMWTNPTTFNTKYWRFVNKLILLLGFHGYPVLLKRSHDISCHFGAKSYKCALSTSSYWQITKTGVRIKPPHLRLLVTSLPPEPWSEPCLVSACDGLVGRKQLTLIY